MRSIFFVILLAVSLAACSNSAPKHQARILGVSTADAASAARIISQYRVAHGLAPVMVNAKLNQMAEAKAREIAVADSLSHTLDEFSARLYKFQIHGAASENLSAGSGTVEKVIARWKNSPPHNANMLIREARQIGLARARTDSGYETYWVLVLAANQSDPNNGAFRW